jgi:hypothetical protein
MVEVHSILVFRSTSTETSATWCRAG